MIEQERICATFTHSVGSEKYTCLEIAVHNNHRNVVEWMVNREMTNNLYIAVGDTMDLVENEINETLPREIGDVIDRSPCHIATARGHFHLFVLLLPQRQTEVFYKSLYDLACHLGRLPIVSHLLTHNVVKELWTIEQPSYKGGLEYAIYSGHVEIVKLICIKYQLCSRTCNILHVATQAKRHAVVKYLLGENIGSLTQKEHIDAREYFDDKWVKQYPVSAFTRAVQTQDVSMVKLYTDHMTDLQMCTDGDAVHCAIQLSNTDCMTCLLDACPDVSACLDIHHANNTFLHAAILADNLFAIDWLQRTRREEYDTMLQTTNKENDLPYELAYTSGSLRVFNCLLTDSYQSHVRILYNDSFDPPGAVLGEPLVESAINYLMHTSRIGTVEFDKLCMLIACGQSSSAHDKDDELFSEEEYENADAISQTISFQKASFVASRIVGFHETHPRLLHNQAVSDQLLPNSVPTAVIDVVCSYWKYDLLEIINLIGESFPGVP